MNPDWRDLNDEWELDFSSVILPALLRRVNRQARPSLPSASVRRTGSTSAGERAGVHKRDSDAVVGHAKKQQKRDVNGAFYRKLVYIEISKLIL